jgi:electron transport complex protein RnfB
MINRRDFIINSIRLGIAAGLAAIGIDLAKRTFAGKTVWQLDPAKCVQCDRCSTACVLTPSAVKSVNVYNICGYCDLCDGYLKTGATELNTAAENLICPTSAISRKFVEEPFFQYDINETLCIGCAKCVKGCAAFGNGSLQLQVRHNICVNCNECAIARVCPSEAFSRVPADHPYLLKGI